METHGIMWNKIEGFRRIIIYDYFPLYGKSVRATLCQDMLFFNFYSDQFYALSLDISLSTSPTFLLWPYDLTIHEQNGFIIGIR